MVIWEASAHALLVALTSCLRWRDNDKPCVGFSASIVMIGHADMRKQILIQVWRQLYASYPAFCDLS